jgi:hypothetical protein
MNTVYVMNGDERTIGSRQLNNNDRTQRIQSQKKSIEYESHLIYKPKINPQYHRTLEEIMSEKVRIRSRRNM